LPPKRTHTASFAHIGPWGIYLGHFKNFSCISYVILCIGGGKHKISARRESQGDNHCVSRLRHKCCPSVWHTALIIRRPKFNPGPRWNFVRGNVSPQVLPANLPAVSRQVRGLTGIFQNVLPVMGCARKVKGSSNSM